MATQTIQKMGVAGTESILKGSEGAFGIVESVPTGPVSVDIYKMRAIQDGTTTVYWDSENMADTAGTGPGVPSGTLTDIVTVELP